MRSGSRISAALVGLATLPVVVLLSGCVTTEQVAARARLVDARIRASQSPLRLTHRNPDVRVTRLWLLQGPSGTALAVALRNTSTRSLTDLPISVGLTTATGRKLYLNHSANVDYLDNHVVVMAPRSLVTWVYTSGRRLPGAVRPFAEVGVTQLPEPVTGTLPRVAVSRARSAASSAARTLTVSVSKLSGIPQYGVPVYAVAVRSGRLLAAGRAIVAHLATHGGANVPLALLGRPGNASLRLSVLPTIFQ